jgi:RND family efflux transporter MFP subunit
MLRATALLAFLLAPVVAAASEHRAQCVLEPSMSIRLASAAVGLLAAVPVDRGDRVHAGQVVAELDSALQRVELELAILRAESEIESEVASARLELSELRGARTEALYERRIATEEQYQETLAERRLVALEIRRAAQEAAAAQIERRRVEEALAQRVIRSPIDGVVIERLLGPGEFAHQEAPVLRIARIDPLYVETFLPASMLPAIDPEGVARVFPQAPVGGEYEARVLVVDPFLDPASGTFGVRLELANPDGRLQAGLRCEVAFAPVPGD